MNNRSKRLTNNQQLIDNVHPYFAQPLKLRSARMLAAYLFIANDWVEGAADSHGSGLVCYVFFQRFPAGHFGTTESRAETQDRSSAA